MFNVPVRAASGVLNIPLARRDCRRSPVGLSKEGMAMLFKAETLADDALEPRLSLRPRAEAAPLPKEDDSPRVLTCS